MHKKTHVTENKGKTLTVTCDRKGCGMKFRANAHLNVHLKIHDNDLLKCSFCPYTGAQRSNYAVHMNTHFRHAPFKCTQCTHKFYQSNVLAEHVELIHERDIEKYSCEICYFKTYSHRIMHRHKCTKTTM